MNIKDKKDHIRAHIDLKDATYVFDIPTHTKGAVENIPRSFPKNTHNNTQSTNRNNILPFTC